MKKKLILLSLASLLSILFWHTIHAQSNEKKTTYLSLNEFLTKGLEEESAISLKYTLRETFKGENPRQDFTHVRTVIKKGFKEFTEDEKGYISLKEGDKMKWAGNKGSLQQSTSNMSVIETLNTFIQRGLLTADITEQTTDTVTIRAKKDSIMLTVTFLKDPIRPKTYTTTDANGSFASTGTFDYVIKNNIPILKSFVETVRSSQDGKQVSQHTKTTEWTDVEENPVIEPDLFTETTLKRKLSSLHKGTQAQF